MREKRTRRGKRLPTARAREAGIRRQSTRVGATAALTAHAANTAPPDLLPGAAPVSTSPAGTLRTITTAGVSYARRWLIRHDWTLWALLAVTLLALIPRLYGINWDANNHLHPDERAIVFKSICLSFPGTPRAPGCDPAYTGPGWFFSPSSPLNPHFFAYGIMPQYLLALVAHGLAWLTSLTHGAFHPPDGGAWDDFNHFTLVGRALSALFDTGSVLLSGLIARRLMGRRGALLAAAFVATIPFDVQVSHFYAVDTLLLFFILLTLLGCVILAQGPREATTAAGEQRVRSAWRAWGSGLFVGLGFGLAVATKVSAAPLLAPIAVALFLRWRRCGFDDAVLALLGIAGAAVLTFLVTSPYALIDWTNFSAQVNEQLQLSRGQLDYPYVRQFANTTPYVYEIQQMLLYDMGLPLGLLGLAGAAWAVSRVWRRLESDWLILVVWLGIYFAVAGSAYTKFTRYMLPIFALLAICGAGALAALAAWGVHRLTAARSSAPDTNTPATIANAAPVAPLPAHGEGSGARFPFLRVDSRLWRTACVALALTILACSTFFTLALVNIYSTPNTRVQASEWIYNHVRPGATLTNEIWDDPLPIQVPPASMAAGAPLTAAGHVINPSEYGQVGLDLYADDTPQKAQALAQQLAGADVVVISSQRLVRSIPKLLDRYPMTTRYYQLLFAGKLGFTLAAHFQNAPNFLGLTINDSGADESYSVYDHPPVWIFVKQGAGLSTAQIQQELTAGLTLPATSSRPGSQKSLLLSQQDQAADAQSQPIGIQFPANSLPNNIPLLWWLIVIELLGLVTFPLTFFVFRGLKDRGWGVSKTLGILLLAYLTWLPASLRVLPFDTWEVMLAFAVIVAAGAAVAWRWREQMWAFVRQRWRLLVIGEALFLAAFLYFTWIRALDPDLWHIYRGGEKPMELAFLNAILHSRYMPPYDPWFSGGYINYYYYGQYIVAVLIRLTGITPTVAFNLAIPLLFGLTFSGAFSVLAGLTGKWWAGLCGGVALVVVGNLDGLWQFLNQVRAFLAHVPIPAFDYWQSSRVIPCDTISGVQLPNCAQTTINEFPYWSYLYADLHAHVIDLPIVVLIIAACASILATIRHRPAQNGSSQGWLARLLGMSRRPSGRDSQLPARHWDLAPTLVVLALALGAAWCTSTWDVPTYGLLIAIVLALRLLVFGGANGDGMGAGGWRAWIAWPRMRVYLAAVGLTFAATYLLYFPFHADYQNLTSGIGTVNTPTEPFQFFTLFGIWLFLLTSFFFVELRDRLARHRAAQLSPRAALVDGQSAAPATTSSRTDTPLPMGEGPGERSSDAYLPSWLPLAGLAVVLLFAYLISLKTLLIILLAVGLYLALDRRHSPTKLLTYILLLLGLAVALGVEFIYIRDFLDNSPYERMNTVFKFYYQVWTFFALGGALAFVQIAHRFFPLAASAPIEDASLTGDVISVPAAASLAAAAAPVGAPPAASDDAVGASTGRPDADADQSERAAMRSGPPLPAGSRLRPQPVSGGHSPEATGEGGTGAGGEVPWRYTTGRNFLLRLAWTTALLALLFGSSIFLVEGTQARLRDPAWWAAVQPPPGGVQPQGLSLDGMAYMRGWYPGDYAAINWMNTHIGGDPTIVEASNGNYQWYGRVSEYTGLPDVLGWGSREYEQRYGDEIFPRQSDVQAFWATEDPNAALAFLRQYGVRYIYLGHLERTCYVTNPDGSCVPMSQKAIAKFQALVSAGAIQVVYTNPDVTIYEVAAS